MRTGEHVMKKWIWQQPDWTQFSWNETIIVPKTRQLHLKIGMLLGHDAESIQKQKLTLDALVNNLISSSAIEGEALNVNSIRSSLARHLNIPIENEASVTIQTELMAKILIDALENTERPLTFERLIQWHQWLFADPQNLPLYKIRIGELRGDEPMQVVSGRWNAPKVHFQVPDRLGLEGRLEQFVQWFNQSLDNVLLDPFIRAGIAHFWFVTLHPFDDGNGRITRMITDLALAQMDKQSIRLYAMSSTILKRRSSYYEILEQSQKGTSDITEWLNWFLETLEQSLDETLDKIQRTLFKAQFWKKYDAYNLSEAQIKVLNRLLDGGERGFLQGINASQYQKVAKVSKATATRHLTYLLQMGCLVKMDGGGRNTRYQVNLSLSILDA